MEKRQADLLVGRAESSGQILVNFEYRFVMFPEELRKNNELFETFRKVPGEWHLMTVAAYYDLLRSKMAAAYREMVSFVSKTHEYTKRTIPVTEDVGRIIRES